MFWRNTNEAAVVTGTNEAEIFPILTPEQIGRIAPLARERTFADGASVWNQGDRNNPMFVVVEGEIAILSGTDQLVTVHHPGAFSGDVDLLSGRPTVVRARAQGVARVLELSQDHLKRLVQTDAELSEIFLRAFMLRRIALVARGHGNAVLIGSRHSAGTLAIQEFLTRNNQPYAYLDVDVDADVQATLDSFGVGVGDVSVFICRGERVLKKPTTDEVGECLGLNQVNEETLRDLVVIGAGPAGLAAAVYAASEGLDVLVVESSAPGGQAGSSSRIENYLGFPTGISGQLLASNALVQAEKFGAEFVVARTAVRLGCQRLPYRIDVGGGHSVQARTVIIATAGQAAVYLSSHGRHVNILVRGPGLADSVSRYLIRRIEETPNITLFTRMNIEALEGDARLERVTWRDGAGKRTTVDIRHVFLMTGADPNTAWLSNCVAVGEGSVCVQLVHKVLAE